MHLRAALILVILAPSVAAESVHIQALGGTAGWQSGVTGLQWDEDSAIGARYYLNQTSGDEAAIVLTMCITNDAHTVNYCERHHVAA